MGRPFVVTVGPLAAAAWLAAASGCTKTSDGASDASTVGGDAQGALFAMGEGSIEGTSCAEAGGQCAWQSCSALGNQECGATGGQCCLDALNARICEAGAPLIQASSYDQSCSVDTDCVAVGVGNPCTAICEIFCAGNAAISEMSLARYMMDKSNLPASLLDVGCGCPIADPSACCVAGTCSTACTTPIEGDDGGPTLEAGEAGEDDAGEDGPSDSATAD
jgi:hypothetical protein